VTDAIVVAWTKVVARRIERIAVVFGNFTNVDLTLTHRAVVSLALASPPIDNLKTVASPVT
jgi:hypothetical protein